MNLSDQLEKLKNPDSITKTTLAYASLAYGIGFLWLNCTFAWLWGFSDFNIFSVQCVLATIEIGILAAFAFVPLAIGRKLTDPIRRLSNRWSFFRWIRGACIAVLVIVAAVEVAVVLAKFVCPSLFQSFVSQHAAGAVQSDVLLFSALLYVVAVIACIPLFGLWGDRQKRKVLWYEKVISALIGLVLIPYCLMFYIAIPVRWGGGGPERRDLWVSSVALPMLAPCSREAKHEMQIAQKRGSGHDNDLFLVEGLYLLHEKSGSLILWSNECSVILEVSKDLVKGDQWPNRQSRAEVQP
jgi:hypothetical protein